MHSQVSENIYNFSLIYTAGRIFPVQPIKNLVNQDCEPNTPHKLETGKKPSVSYLHVLFFPFVLKKSTAHVDTKALNIRHQSHKGFRGIFIGILHHQKWYLIYVSST